MTPSSQLDAGMIVRRSLFFSVLIILTLGNLFVLFKGLDSPQAMDQAQISREIARGNGFTTKMVRPVAYDQAQRDYYSQVAQEVLVEAQCQPRQYSLGKSILTHKPELFLNQT